MEYFDPSEYVRGLQQLLVSDKKRIGFLLGAGTSLARKNEKSLTVPAFSKMTELIVEELSKTENFKCALNEIKNEIGEEKYNIESVLSNIETKRNIIGNGVLNNLRKGDFDNLINATKKEIMKIVSIHKDIIEKSLISSLVHVDFAEWIGRAERKHPVEIFTTNYDYLIELGLENKSIPYYDGFIGSYNPFFNPDSVETMNFLPNHTKLWKIHGSLGWKQEGNKVIRKESSENDILIYPSILKYDNSRKLPYISLMDRLTNYLKQPDSILIVSGYSFGDEHINERIVTALKSQTTAHVFALLYDKEKKFGLESYSLTSDSSIANLAKENSKISVLGCRSAVIGSKFGKWRAKKPNNTEGIESYYKTDEGENGEEGYGELIITDFTCFTKFLLNMIVDIGDFSNE